MVKTKCEVYSRVVGYIRPVQQWNDGKQAEYHRRKVFDSGKALGKAEGMGDECKSTGELAITPTLKVSCGC